MKKLRYICLAKNCRYRSDSMCLMVHRCPLGKRVSLAIKGGKQNELK